MQKEKISRNSTRQTVRLSNQIVIVVGPTLSSPRYVVEVVWESKWQGNSPLAKKQTNALWLAFGMNQMNGLIMFLPKENYTVIPEPQPYDFATSCYPDE